MARNRKKKGSGDGTEETKSKQAKVSKAKRKTSPDAWERHPEQTLRNILRSNGAAAALAYAEKHNLGSAMKAIRFQVVDGNQVRVRWVDEMLKKVEGRGLVPAYRLSQRKARYMIRRKLEGLILKKDGSAKKNGMADAEKWVAKHPAFRSAGMLRRIKLELEQKAAAAKAGAAAGAQQPNAQ
ncbi:MAG: hypothetical protein KGI60_01455 [Patescibacteria group bacterium]|nr:hypothetical protein [Patescibacteria group bacterium]